MRDLKLTRTTFHDRPLDAQHLWAAAEIWRGAFRLTGFLTTGVYELCTEIWGFPRQDTPALRTALEQAIPDCTVEHAHDDDGKPNPDLLLVRSPWIDLARPVNLAPWLTPLLEPACDGLFVVLRMRVCNVAPDARRIPTKTNTLALGGPAQAGTLLLKACWHVGPTRITEKVLRGSAWEHEAALLRAIDTFLQRFAEHAATAPGSPEYDAALADAQDAGWYTASAIGSEFHTRRKEGVHDVIARYIAEFPDDHSLAAFVRRVLKPLILLLVAGYLWLRTPTALLNVRPLLAGLAALGGYLAGRVVYLKAKRAIRYHRAMNTGLARLYAGEVRVDKQPLPPAVESDPTCRKYSAEIAATGARHCFDFKLVTASEHDSTQRLFVLHDHNTFATLSVMTRAGRFNQFPGLPILHLSTYFNNGTRLATVAGRQSGYRKNRITTSLGRFYPDAHHPADLLAHHIANVRRLTDRGLVPLPADPERFPELIVKDHEQTRDFYARHTIYSWPDAVHEAFTIPRKQKDL